MDSELFNLGKRDIGQGSIQRSLGAESSTQALTYY